MHAVELTAWDDWGHHKDDPFEDAILEAESEEGKRLIDAVDDIRSFMEHDLWNHTFSSTKERDEAEFVFDALVKEAKKRFYAYSAKLGYIEATHGHP